MDGLLLQVLATPEGRADPYAYYAQMRQGASITRTALGPLLVHGYDDCMTVLRDPRLGRGLRGQGSGLIAYAGGDESLPLAFLELSKHNMLLADPPDHTRLRHLVSRSFTPRRIEELRGSMQQLVDDLTHRTGEGDGALPRPAR